MPSDSVHSSLETALVVASIQIWPPQEYRNETKWKRATHETAPRDAKQRALPIEGKPKVVALAGTRMLYAMCGQTGV
ncbi:hypothetical protein LTS14_006556 [Recurvomyces mirabilis]|uniref:uncharacterized protein n=1 Tax=Recurvomyces mirabilis TaxID=574656 RepID=UPI002DDF0B51|nr:hypothetical protein LTS14_006556 [Recurvomyces mirabilis]